MAQFSSKEAVIAIPVADLYGRMSHLSGLQEQLDRLPQDQLAQIGEVRFTDDSVSITTAQVGEIRFNVVDRVESERVVFAAANSPVPMKLIVDMAPANEASTSLKSTIDVEIPAMLRPLVGGKMKEAAERFTELVAQLNGRG